MSTWLLTREEVAALRQRAEDASDFFRVAFNSPHKRDKKKTENNMPATIEGQPCEKHLLVKEIETAISVFAGRGGPVVDLLKRAVRVLHFLGNKLDDASRRLVSARHETDNALAIVTARLVDREQYLVAGEHRLREWTEQNRSMIEARVAMAEQRWAEREARIEALAQERREERARNAPELADKLAEATFAYIEVNGRQPVIKADLAARLCAELLRGEPRSSLKGRKERPPG